MKLLREGKRRIFGCVTPRALALATAALFGVLLPTAASADEANVQLNFSNSQVYLWISLAFGFLAIIFAAVLSRSLLAHSPGSEKMQEVGRAIKEGALAYLKRQ